MPVVTFILDNNRIVLYLQKSDGLRFGVELAGATEDILLRYAHSLTASAAIHGNFTGYEWELSRTLRRTLGANGFSVAKLLASEPDTIVKLNVLFFGGWREIPSLAVLSRIWPDSTAFINERSYPADSVVT